MTTTTQTFQPGDAVMELSEHLHGVIVEDAGTTDDGQMYEVDFGRYRDTVPARLLVAEDDEIPTAHGIAERFGVTMEVERVTPSEVSKLPHRCQHCAATLRPTKGTRWSYQQPAQLMCTSCDSLVKRNGEPIEAQAIEYRCTLRRGRASMVTPYSRGAAWQFTGDDVAVGDVLDALRSDAACWLGVRDADEFLRELCDVAGADDPIQAVRDGERMYQECGDTYKRLEELLGKAGRDALLAAEGC